MSNKNNNNKQNNIDFSPILNSLENINNTLKTIANVFYEQNNQSNEQQKRVEESINRQLNLFKDVATTFRNVIHQLRREEEEQRRNRQQNNQNNNQQQSFIRSSLKKLISALRGIGQYQIATFQSLDRFLKVENEFKTRQAREINNLFGRINNNSQRFFRQFIQEIDEIYNEKNYFKSMAESLKHIAEVHILLKPFVRNMVARGINPFCCGAGVGSEKGFNQLLHIGGEDIQTNLARVLRYARFGSVIEEEIVNILSNIEQSQHPYRKFFSKLPLIGGFASNDQIRLLKAAQSEVLQNFLQTSYFNLNERILERFFSFDIRRRERFQNQLIQLVSRYIDKQGRIDETVLTNLGNNINRLTNYIETFNRYSQYFTNTDKFAINKLLLNLDNHFVLQTRFLESLENITQDLDIQLRAYNTTLQNQLSEDTLRDVNNILRSVVLRDIARGRISDANLNEINTMIENILRQRNLSEEQIRVFLELISNTYNRLATNYSEHLRDAIEREYQYRGISRKTIDDLAKRLGSEYTYLAEEIARNMILRRSRIFRFTSNLLNNRIYKWLETIAVSMAFRSFFLFKLPFIGPALAGLGFPWNIAVGLLFAPLIYKRGAIISFMVRHLTPLLQRGFGKVQQLISKYIPDSVKNFFDTVTTNVRNIITKFRQSRFWNNTLMFKLRTVIGTSVGNVFRSLLGFNLKQPSQPVQPEVIQRAYTGETTQTLNLQQTQNNTETILNNIANIIGNLNTTLSTAINSIQNILTDLQNSLAKIINKAEINIDLSNIIQAINHLQNSIGYSLDNIYSLLRKQLNNLLNSIDVIPYALSGIHYALRDIYYIIQINVLQSLNNIHATLSNLKNNQNNVSNNIINIDLSSIIQHINNLQNTLVQSINKLQNSIFGYINNLQNTFIQSIDKLQNSISGYINNLQNTFIQSIDKLQNNTIQSLNNLYTLLQNQTTNIITNIEHISHILDGIANNLQNLKNNNIDETFKQGLSDNIRLIGETLENISKQSINIDNRLLTLDDSLNRLYNQYAIKKDGIDSLKVYVTNFDDLCNCIRNKSSIPPMPGINSLIGSSLFGFGDPTFMLLWALANFAPHLFGGIKSLFKLGWKGLKWAGSKGWKGLKWLGDKGWKGLKWIGDKGQKGLKWLGSKGWEGLKLVGDKGQKGLKWLRDKSWEGLKLVGDKGQKGLKWLGDKSWESLKSLGGKGLETLKSLGGKGLDVLSQSSKSSLIKTATKSLGRFALSRTAGAAIGGLIGGPIGLIAGLALPSLIEYAADKLLNKSEDASKLNSATAADTNVNTNNAQNTSITQHDHASLYNALQTQIEHQKQTNNILNNIHKTLQTIDSSINNVNDTLKNKLSNINNTYNVTQNNSIMDTQPQQSVKTLDTLNQLKRWFGF